MIPTLFISQLTSAIDINDVISAYVPIKKMGRNSKCLCPFHNENTPSMVVYSDTQSFYCFGCSAGGDAINFVMRAEDVGYVEAVKILAQRYGMQLPEENSDDKTEIQKKKILEINKETALFFYRTLMSPVGQIGYDYLTNRGLSKKTIVEYGLGFAPNSWDSLKKHLQSKGYTQQEMLLAGVVVSGKNDSVYDQFRNRVMFPIIDVNGKVIAFGGRVMDESKPKYLNSSDSLVFKKSRNLFSLNFAKKINEDDIILAEGYMDVIAINNAGFKNVVATLGTALTDEQARLISKYAKRVIIAYDSDEAGKKATMRAINILSKSGLQNSVIEMNGAKDPDEYIKKFGVKRFESILNNASDVIEHQLEQLKNKYDLTTADSRLQYTKKALYILSDIENSIEREVYAVIVAKHSGITIDSIMSQTTQIIKQKKSNDLKKEWRDIEQNTAVSKDKINPERKHNLKQSKAEEIIITYLFKNPEQLSRIGDSICIENFVTEFNRRVYSNLLEYKSMPLELSISMISKDFSHEELGAISGIIARNSVVNIDVESVDKCIQLLATDKLNLNEEQIKSANLDDIQDYINALKHKKKGKPNDE